MTVEDSGRPGNRLTQVTTICAKNLGIDTLVANLDVFDGGKDAGELRRAEVVVRSELELKRQLARTRAADLVQRVQCSVLPAIRLVQRF